MSEDTDIIVGIPSYNEEDNISFVVKQLDEGLRKYFSEKRAVIVCADSNSTDRTKKVFLNTETSTEKRFMTIPKGMRGKGHGLRMTFKVARDWDAKVIAIVDADLRNINREWVRLLIGPIFKGYDFVAPYYLREKYDATVTNHICYPIVYGLLGKNIRQPIGGDFSFSNRLAKYWLRRQWQKTTRQYGIDIFMTLNAIFGGFRICQASLGLKIHKPSEQKLGEMFTQVIRTLFEILLENRKKWINNTVFEEEKTFGIKTLPEEKLNPDMENIFKMAINLYQKEKLMKYLSEEVFQKVNSMYFTRNMDFDNELWAKTVYDLIYSYRKEKNKGDVVNSMRSLCFGRIYSFFNQIGERHIRHVESEIREQARCFRRLRGYLIEKFQSA